MLKEAIPSMEKVRFVNSGTESVMTTIRIARAYTGRSKIIKFAGCYHGHSDLVLVAAGSGPSTLGMPGSAGVPFSIAQEVITVPFNDLDGLRKALDTWGENVAAVIVEPAQSKWEAFQKQLMFDKAGVAFVEGSVFGEQGAGYLRVNLACPRALLLEALDKFAGAIQEENTTR